MASALGVICDLITAPLRGNALTAGRVHEVTDARDHSTRRLREVALIAEGAFGAVLRVKEIGTSLEFALKKIRCEEGVQVASSFEAALREAKVLTDLPPHPNIITFYGHAALDRGEGVRVVKLMMELCSSGHLLDYMGHRKGRLSPREVLEPFAQVASAVSHLHAQDPPIQHRDLKPENVILGAHGKWKLCDFGSASTHTVTSAELPRHELLRLQEDIDKTVTMLYRPPEMADLGLNHRQGYAITPAVDLWMLGCILFMLAFYRHPFQDNATALGITSGTYFMPSDRPLAGSGKICGLIHWLLAVDHKDRPSVQRLLQALQELGATQYEDMLDWLPTAVRDKIDKFARSGVRRSPSLDDQIPGSVCAQPSPSSFRRAST